MMRSGRVTANPEVTLLLDRLAANFLFADDPETVRCWLGLRCLHNVPDIIRSLLKHANPIRGNQT